MDVQDLRALSEGCVIRADICIVGSGPAGLTLARELSNMNMKVVLLESGGREFDPWTERLNDIENVGAERVQDQSLVRNRIFGGTSATWSGRVATFSEIDFMERSWVPNSGWPIARTHLMEYFDRSVPHLGITIADNDHQRVQNSGVLPLLDLDTRYLTNYSWSYSRDPVNPKDFLRFGPRALTEHLPGVHAFLHATATHINTTSDGQLVTGLEVAGADGLRRNVEARYIILAAGGIENARLLLASNRSIRGGVGNNTDAVGRYLADHPRGPVGHFDEQGHREIQRRFGSHYVFVDGQSTTVTVGVALSPQVQQTEHLLNCSMWVSGVPSIDDPINCISHVLKTRGVNLVDVANVVQGAGLLAEGAKRYFIDHRSPLRRLRELSLQAMVEQQPDRNSRVTLGDRVDAFGVPLPRIDWRINELEARTVRRAAELFVLQMKRLGAPTPRLSTMIVDDSHPFGFQDVAHPSGSTRMSAEPRDGVVDANCEVHGVHGLFISGSSIFPTNGHANPTQMIVVMAIRLADEIKRRLTIDRGGRSVAVGLVPVGPTTQTSLAPQLHSSDEGRPVVLVTGASGKVGRVVLDLLIQKGYAVRALTSRMRVTVDDTVDWRVRDLRRSDLDFREEVSGVSAVVHLGAELRHEADMYRTNVEATSALARAAAAEGVTFFCFVSSVSVYGSASARESRESSRLITPSVDIPGEYWGNSALRAYGAPRCWGRTP